MKKKEKSVWLLTGFLTSYSLSKRLKVNTLVGLFASTVVLGMIKDGFVNDSENNLMKSGFESAHQTIKKVKAFSSEFLHRTDGSRVENSTEKTDPQ